MTTAYARTRAHAHSPLTCSDHHKRTQRLGGGRESSVGYITLAAVYSGDKISFYRNGQPYGSSYRKGTPETFSPNNVEVLFGLRHKSGNNAGLAADIWSARLYHRALTAKEIADMQNSESSPRRLHLRVHSLLVYSVLFRIESLHTSCHLFGVAGWPFQSL